LHAPPLPLTAAEARPPHIIGGLETWLQCSLSIGVTMAYKRFVEEHPRADARSAAPFAMEPRMSMKFLSSSVSAEI